MAYPIRVTVTPPATHDRLTVAFRIILAIPHTILVGPVVWFYRAGSLGLLGAVVLRWRTRAVGYTALLVDPYPLFSLDV